jgi:hypothetical protein
LEHGQLQVGRGEVAAVHRAGEDAPRKIGLAEDAVAALTDAVLTRRVRAGEVASVGEAEVGVRERRAAEAAAEEVDRVDIEPGQVDAVEALAVQLELVRRPARAVVAVDHHLVEQVGELRATPHQRDDLLLRRLDELAEIRGVNDLNRRALGDQRLRLFLNGLAGRDLGEHEEVSGLVNVLGDRRPLRLRHRLELFALAVAELAVEDDGLSA